MSNLSNTGEAHFANPALTNSPYTTNRILEIPQDIKLELNDGTLTLKAGSKVYVPNGSGNFDVITTTQDYTADTSAYSGLYILAISETTGLPTGITTIQDCVSGGTAPSSPTSLQGWYDTTNNVIRRYSGGSIQTTFRCSFPLCSVTSNGTQITSIDQVFNGFGYIGSTVFALPGVKVQIPNGRNTDGTCKSGVITSNSVVTKTTTGGASDKWIIFNGSNVYLNSKTNEVFDADSNYWKYDGVRQTGIGCFGGVYFDGAKVSSFTPYTVDSVANANASNFSQAGRSYLSGLGMPSSRYIDLTLGASGSTYTAPANGWFAGWTSTGTGNGYVAFYTGELFNGYANEVAGLSGYQLPLLLPIKKGTNMIILYNQLSLVMFRFYYAEGEN